MPTAFIAEKGDDTFSSFVVFDKDKYAAVLQRLSESRSPKE
jgi:hypothetical protein